MGWSYTEMVMTLELYQYEWNSDGLELERNKWNNDGVGAVMK